MKLKTGALSLEGRGDPIRTVREAIGPTCCSCGHEARTMWPGASHAQSRRAVRHLLAGRTADWYLQPPTNTPRRRLTDPARASESGIDPLHHRGFPGLRAIRFVQFDFHRHAGSPNCCGSRIRGTEGRHRRPHSAAHLHAHWFRRSAMPRSPLDCRRPGAPSAASRDIPRSRQARNGMVHLSEARISASKSTGGQWKSSAPDVTAPSRTADPDNR